jgi:hypothetical protein
MEQNLLGRQAEIFQDADPYSKLKEDFGQIFYENNLSSFTDPSNLGFSDFNKASHYEQRSKHIDAHHHVVEPESFRGAAAREDHSSYQDLRHNPSYSPINQAHYHASHFNPSLNGNFPYSGAKQQPYQQEHPGFSGYHAPNYYYSNHYDPHAGHENGIDYYHRNQDVVDTHNDDPLSVMWSNEAAKTMQYKNVAGNGVYNSSAMKSKLASGFGAYEQDGQDEMYAKRSQMIKLQELSRAPGQVVSLNGLSKAHNAMEMNLGNKAISVNVRYDKPVHKASVGKDSFDEDDNGDDDGYDGEGKGRSTRGLRVLSLKVKEIVAQKKRTTYKEVAETLTFELRQKLNARSAKEETKDEQNVKRRVYDALNVLIAAGVLRKEGKIVYCDESSAQNGFANRKASKEDKNKLLLDIQEARKKNKAKLEMLQELIFKCLAIKNLIKTNKEKAESGLKPKARPGNVSATRIDVVQENPALKPKNEDVIKFPFIVLLSSSAENSMNLNMDTSQRQLAIESRKPFNIFGDIDVLLKMGLHYVTRQMFNESLPVELQRYVPKYFLAALK